MEAREYHPTLRPGLAVFFKEAQMRRSVIVPLLLVVLAALPGCKFTNDQLLATGVIAGVTTLGVYTLNSVVDSAAQRRQQEDQSRLQAQRQQFDIEEQRAARLAAERFQWEQLEIQKDQLRRMR